MNWWQQFGQGIGEDFGDLPGPATIARVCVRLVVAAVLGGLLGYQREHTGKSAGVRTHALVAIGAALLMAAAARAVNSRKLIRCLLALGRAPGSASSAAVRHRFLKILDDCAKRKRLY